MANSCPIVPKPLLPAKIHVLKFTFVTPSGDPLDPAEMRDEADGDGQNQFTFDGGYPGVLTISLKVRVDPPGMAGRIAKDCSFTLPQSVGNSRLAWSPANPGGRTAADGDHLVATATYTNLPAYNSSFGVMETGLWYKDSPQAESRFAVYYPKDARNNPENKNTPDPNWFYYYKTGGALWNTQGQHNAMRDCEFDPSLDDDTLGEVTLPSANPVIRLGKKAAHERYPRSLFPDLMQTTYQPIIVGGNGRGLQCLAQVLSKLLDFFIARAALQRLLERVLCRP